MRMSDYFGLPDVTTFAAHHFSFLPKFKGCEPETIHSENEHSLHADAIRSGKANIHRQGRRFKPARGYCRNDLNDMEAFDPASRITGIHSR